MVVGHEQNLIPEGVSKAVDGVEVQASVVTLVVPVSVEVPRGINT